MNDGPNEERILVLSALALALELGFQRFGYMLVRTRFRPLGCYCCFFVHSLHAIKFITTAALSVLCTLLLDLSHRSVDLLPHRAIVLRYIRQVVVAGGRHLVDLHIFRARLVPTGPRYFVEPAGGPSIYNYISTLPKGDNRSCRRNSYSAVLDWQSIVIPLVVITALIGLVGNGGSVTSWKRW